MNNLFCKNCGKELPDDVMFCPNCNAMVGRAKPLNKQPDNRNRHNMRIPAFVMLVIGVLACGIIGFVLFFSSSPLSEKEIAKILPEDVVNYYINDEVYTSSVEKIEIIKRQTEKKSDFVEVDVTLADDSFSREVCLDMYLTKYSKGGWLLDSWNPVSEETLSTNVYDVDVIKQALTDKGYKIAGEVQYTESYGDVICTGWWLEPDISEYIEWDPPYIEVEREFNDYTKMIFDDRGEVVLPMKYIVKDDVFLNTDFVEIDINGTYTGYMGDDKVNLTIDSFDEFEWSFDASIRGPYGNFDDESKLDCSGEMPEEFVVYAHLYSMMSGSYDLKFTTEGAFIANGAIKLDDIYDENKEWYPLTRE